MKLKTPIWAAIVLAAVALPVAAQQSYPDRWHMAGTLGLNLNRTTQTSLFPIAGSLSSSDYDSLAGDLGLTLNGFLKDPQLLPFALDFSGERSSNRVGIGGYNDLLTNFGANTTFLPGRNFPLHFFYRKSQMDATGGNFGQTADTSALGVDWSLSVRHLPRLSTGYTRLTNFIHIPTSIFDNNYEQGHAYVAVRDTWQGWDWSTGFDRYTNDSNFVAEAILPGFFHQDLNATGAHVRRAFWDRKVEFVVDNRNQWRSDNYPGLGVANSRDYYTAASLRILHTPKLTSSYFYDFVRASFAGALGNRLLPGNPGNLTLVNAQTFDSHYGGGQIHYRWTNNVRVFGTVRYQHVTPADSHVEFRESLTEALPGVSYQKRWRAFDIGGQYAGHLQFMNTNLGNQSHTFSNDVQGMVGWGSSRRVRLVGSGSYAKLNLVEQLNGFSRDARVRLEAETRAVSRVALRFTADNSDIEILNQSGDFDQRITTLSAQADLSRVSLSFSRIFGDGAGAIFPEAVRLHFGISNPLPIDQLLRSPLLDRNVHANSATVILRLRRNLDLSASWRAEDNLLGSSAYNFQIIEARARYRIGKLTFDLGYGKYRNESQVSAGNLTGLLTNRYYLRVARDFRLF